MAKKKLPADVEEFLKKEGLKIEELVKAKKAHMERMKKLERRLSFVSAEREIDFEEV